MKSVMHPVGGAGKGGKQQEAAGEDAERAGEEAVEAEAPGTVSNQTLAKAEKVAEEELEMSCFGADPILMFGDNLDESKQVDNPFLPRLSRASDADEVDQSKDFKEENQRTSNIEKYKQSYNQHQSSIFERNNLDADQTLQKDGIFQEAPTLQNQNKRTTKPTSQNLAQNTSMSSIGSQSRMRYQA